MLGRVSSRLFRQTLASATLGLAALSLLASALPAMADEVADFYKGKTVRVIVGFGPGAGYDAYARLAGEFIGRFIPGNPTVVVENMPGAGGRRAAQYLYAAAPQDGTALGLVVQSIALDSLIGEIPGNVDANKFFAIGRLTSNVEMGLAWHSSPVKSLEEAKQKEMSTGSTGAGSASSFVPKMLNDMVGTRFKVISGYGGAADTALAMERGEVDGSMQGLPGIRATRPQWINDKLVVMLWQLALKPDADYPNVPAIGELGTTPEDRQILRLVAGTADIGRSLFATPGVPPARVAALRQAFNQMIADPTFLETARKRNQELDPMGGEELQAIVTEAMSTPPETAQRARSLIVGK